MRLVRLADVLFVAGSTIEGVNIYGASITPDGRIAGPVQVLTSGTGMTFTASVSTNGRVFVRAGRASTSCGRSTPSRASGLRPCG